MALLGALEEFQLELLLQVAERLVDVFVPSLHEPGRPDVRRLELVEIPVQQIANLELLLNYLLCRNGVVCGLSKCTDVRRINLLELSCHVEACNTNQLKVLRLYVFYASLQVVVYVLDG